MSTNYLVSDLLDTIFICIISGISYLKLLNRTLSLRQIMSMIILFPEDFDIIEGNKSHKDTRIKKKEKGKRKKKKEKRNAD